jgi:hypothetical protein
MIFTPRDRLYFVSMCMLGAFLMLAACCALENRLETYDYYDSDLDLSKSSFMETTKNIYGDAV